MAVSISKTATDTPLPPSQVSAMQGGNPASPASFAPLAANSTFPDALGISYTTGQPNLNVASSQPASMPMQGTAQPIKPAPAVMTSAPAKTVADKQTTEVNNIAAQRGQVTPVAAQVPGAQVQPPTTTGGVDKEALSASQMGNAQKVADKNGQPFTTTLANGQKVTLQPTKTTKPGATTPGTTPTTGTQTDAGMVEAPTTQTSPDEQRINDEYDQTLNDYNSKFAEIQKGGSPEENAAVADIQARFEKILDEQRQLNKDTLATEVQAGIRSGRQRYATEIQLGQENAIAQKGIDRLADITRQENTAIQDAKTAIHDKNLKALNDNFQMISSLKKDKQAAIKDLQQHSLAMEQNARAQREEARADTKFKQEQGQLAADNISSSLITLGADGTPKAPSTEQLTAAANQMGIDPNALIGAVSKKMQELQKLNREDLKFELEVSKAQADIAGKNLTDDIKNYEYAKKNGYKGGILDFVAEKKQAGQDNLLSVDEAKKLGVAYGTTKQQAFGINPGKADEVLLGDAKSKAINTAMSGLVAAFPSVTAFEEAKSSIKGLLASGDVEGAKEQLQTYARTAASAAQQEKLEKRDNTLSALDTIQEKLKEFTALKGDTNIFKGLSEDALRKVGTTQSPELAGIANTIALAIVDYRNAVSGAAFTPSEAAGYEEMFPSIGNTGALNTALIDTLKQKFTADTENFYRTKLGNSKYDTIFGDTKNKPVDVNTAWDNYLKTSDPSGDAALASGVDYLIQQGMSKEEARKTILQQKGQSFSDVGADTKQGSLPAGSVNIGAGAAVRNNNPGNLRAVGGAWQKFDTPEQGFDALMSYVDRVKNGQHAAYKANPTIAQFFNTYAPAADDNDPKGYAASVAARLGVDPNTRIGDIDTFKLAKEIARHESSTQISDNIG